MASGINPELGVYRLLLPDPLTFTESPFFLSTHPEPLTQVRGQIWVLRAWGVRVRGEQSNRMGSPAQGSFLRLQESHLLKRARVLGHVSPVWLFATLWTVTHQAPLSLRFSRQDYWSGLPCPPPGDISDPGIEPSSPVSPALQADSLPLAPPRKPLSKRFKTVNKYIINRLAHGYGNCCSQGQVGPEKTFSQRGGCRAQPLAGALIALLTS